ncbi:hypothetical protein AAVH_13388 [Aphelenchoides avenae]|nr:hypothetical protein AAVH_13388 [Aphelenchus avenae]
MTETETRSPAAKIKVSACAASIPSPADFNTAVEECEKERNFGENASKACNCLIWRSRAKSLVGVCPWSTNKHFMKAL